MASWAVILKPNEAFFCPVIPTHLSSYPDTTSLNQVMQLLGEELAQSVARDPQVHASVWQKKRIDIRWSRNRPDLLEKIKECLQQNRILTCSIQSDKAELIAHRLSEDVCQLYKYDVRLTGSILNYLAEKVRQDKSCCTNLYCLKRGGFSEEEISALAEKNVVEEALFILDRFCEANVSRPKECVQKLTQNRVHFGEVYQAVSAMANRGFRLTAEIGEELAASPGFGLQLAKAASLVELIQNIGDLFVGSADRVTAVIWVINQLPRHPHFESNIHLLNSHKNHILKIQETLLAMRQACIYPTPNFYGLLFELIEILYPIELEILQSMVNHSEAIEDALDYFRCACLELKKDGLLFLIGVGEGAREIGKHAFAIHQIILNANRANIQLLPEDFFLTMAHAKYADAISGTIYYLDKNKIPLTRDDFLLLLENRDVAEKLYCILKDLDHEFIWIKRDDFFRLLETGGSDETVQLIKENYLVKRQARQRLLFG